MYSLINEDISLGFLYSTRPLYEYNISLVCFKIVYTNITDPITDCDEKVSCKREPGRSTRCMKPMHVVQIIRKSSVCFINTVDSALFQFHEETLSFVLLLEFLVCSTAVCGFPN